MINNYYSEVFSEKELYLGHLRGRVSKRDRRSLVKFEMKMLSNISNLHKKIQGDYSFSGYSKFIVFEPKQREIQTLRYEDRIVQHVLCDNILAPYFTSRAIPDNCVCQKGKGMHFALERFERRLKEFTRVNKQEGYFLKCDILKYFPSISHTKLKEFICTEIKDARLREFVEGIIDSYHTEPEFLAKYNIKPLAKGEGEKTERGVPIGNQTSQIFGMFYLNKLDRIIKEKYRVKIYSRYMDDFIIVHKDKKFIYMLFDKIKEVVSELELSLNSKSQIFPLKNGVTYLGYRYIITPTGKVIKKVAKKTTKRFSKRAKLLNKAFYDGAINGERVRQSIASFKGHLKHGNCFKIEKELINKIKVPWEEVYKEVKRRRK